MLIGEFFHGSNLAETDCRMQEVFPRVRILGNQRRNEFTDRRIEVARVSAFIFQKRSIELS